jgi:DNA-binding winged helix-turn-helix (wHTH) protein/tetratricopeptide (TPR) repeat protein
MKRGICTQEEGDKITMHTQARKEVVSPSVPYRFGSFGLDPRRRLLTSTSGVLRLPERVFQLLLILVEADGAIVDKNTLAERLWPDQAVTDSNIAQHIYMLRQLLGVKARDRSYIMTLPGKGYWLGVAVNQVHVTGDEDVGKPHASRLDASVLEDSAEFRLYCVGSHLLEARTLVMIRAAIDHFEEALTVKPDYPPALVGLARAYALLAEFWHVPPQPAFARAKHVVLKALGLDGHSALAHATLSEIHMWSRWDWPGAEKELNIATHLGPTSSAVRNNVAWFYACRGATEDAVYEAQRAIALEPSSAFLHLLVGRMLLLAKRYDDGIAYLTNILDINETFYMARRYRAQAYLLKGDAERALLDLLSLPEERSEDPSFRLPMLSRAYADLGDVGRATHLHDALIELGKTDYVPFWNLAITQYGLGRFDDALESLTAAVEQREPAVLFLRTLQWFKELEPKPTFKALLRRIGPP